MDKLTLLATAAQMECPMLLVPMMSNDTDEKQGFNCWCVPCFDKAMTSSHRWTANYYPDGSHLMAPEVCELFFLIDGSKYRDRVCFCCEEEKWACASTTS